MKAQSNARRTSVDQAISRLRCRIQPGVPRRHGFTIVELLVVAAVVILLLSILVLAVRGAQRAAEKSNTIALIHSVKKGLIQFREEIGYYPPILGVRYNTVTGAGTGGVELRRLYPNSVPNPGAAYPPGASYGEHMQEYYSTCTLTDYLIGYGNHQQDGWGRTGLASPNDWSNETPVYGIRHPGPDGVWGATQISGALVDRMKVQTGASTFGYGSVTAPYAIDQGKVYNPYVELKDSSLLAGVAYVNGQVQTFFQGDALPNGHTWETIPKAIVDYWGMPLRYYRKPYPGLPDTSFRAGHFGNTSNPTLSDIFYLRPFEIRSGSAKDTHLADAAGDRSTSHELDVADFAVMSTGPDKRYNQRLRYDAAAHLIGNEYEYSNKDNVIEVGP